jgi:hypothetical protein
VHARRWAGPVLAVGLIFFGFELKGRLPNPYDFVGMILWAAGFYVFFHGVTRSMRENAFRLLYVGLMGHHIAWMVSNPDVAGSIAAWAVLLALATGIVGSAVHRRARKNAYGFVVALLWVALWEMFVESYWTSGWAIGGLIGISSLVVVTKGYLYWAKTGLYPTKIREWLDALPDEEDTSLLTMLTKKRKSVPASLRP